MYCMINLYIYFLKIKIFKCSFFFNVPIKMYHLIVEWWLHNCMDQKSNLTLVDSKWDDNNDDKKIFAPGHERTVSIADIFQFIKQPKY